MAPLGSAWSMTYLPMSDEALLSKAELVASGEIVEAGGVPGRELDETSYRFVVDEILKGAADSNDLTLRLPGAFDQTASGALIIPGMPRFAVGEKALLFLNRRPDNSYSPSQLMLGVFREREDVTGSPVFTQDLRQLEAIGSPGNPPGNGRSRNAQRFEKWIRDRAQGRPNNERYWSDNDLKPGGKYQLSDPLVRWFQFRQGDVVQIYASQGGQASDTQSLQSAVSTWNADPGSDVQLAYGGLSAKTSGLKAADGVNLVLFNDPNDELLGTFDCLLGGIGAYGVWRSVGVRAFGDAMYGEIYEGDIVVQDGLSCLFDKGHGESMSELLAHELGHVLGFGHSCGEGLLAVCTAGTVEDDALMRPTLHADGRGAALGSDDVAALLKLYPVGGIGSGGTATPGSDADEASAGGGAFPWPQTLMLLIGAMIGPVRRSARVSRLRARKPLFVRGNVIRS
ncbi:MAG TPA: hypothetical protein VGE51_15670 [Fontimonas sp.]